MIQKGIKPLYTKNYDIVTNGKSFYDQPVHSDIKRSEEMTKLSAGQF